MSLNDEPDQLGAHAPLLTPTETPDDDDEALTSELQYSGGWFIWILTFSAGISGLLFGYEYDFLAVCFDCD